MAAREYNTAEGIYTRPAGVATPAGATFDTSYPLMAQASEAGAWTIAYEQQVAHLESLLRPGMTILDVGCGPALPYRAPHSYVIGLDPSSASLAVNTDVDERLCADASAAIPLPAESVDLVVAFYSLHHMTGRSRRETHLIRARAQAEMDRVVKPGGSVLVFEMAPNPLARALQWLLWPTAKRLLGDRLDAYFWGDEELANPNAAGLLVSDDVQTFSCSPFALFPPVFQLPWLKLPRLLYPFAPTLYTWRIPPYKE